MSRFLIDLHRVQKITFYQESFLSLEVMSRLGTEQSVVFRQPSRTTSFDERLQEEGEESMYSHDHASTDAYDV